MKKNSLILLICLFFFNISKGNSISFPYNFEKYEKATIHFLDGTSIRGYGRIVKFLKVYKIKFKASLDGKPETWTPLMISGITFHINNENFDFEYVKIRKTTAPRLLELI